ncbi:hypothetical protein HDU76_010074 [Blyttiomyces sp. JEL0837]|nr:hypothetical protein HDU76_010074 [Blyttiomyces sp. JEL0837]
MLAVKFLVFFAALIHAAPLPQVPDVNGLDANPADFMTTLDMENPMIDTTAVDPALTNGVMSLQTIQMPDGATGVDAELAEHIAFMQSAGAGVSNFAADDTVVDMTPEEADVIDNLIDTTSDDDMTAEAADEIDAADEEDMTMAAGFVDTTAVEDMTAEEADVIDAADEEDMTMAAGFVDTTAIDMATTEDDTRTTEEDTTEEVDTTMAAGFVDTTAVEEDMPEGDSSFSDAMDAAVAVDDETTQESDSAFSDAMDAAAMAQEDVANFAGEGAGTGFSTADPTQVVDPTTVDTTTVDTTVNPADTVDPAAVVDPADDEDAAMGDA